MTDTKPEIVIGHPAHSIFSLNPAPGQINGIAEIFQSALKVSVDRLVGFDLLSADEEIVFDAPACIEVVCFDSERSDMGWQDSIGVYVVYMEEGGSLVGPVVYRKLSDQKGAELKDKEEKFNASLLRGTIAAISIMAMMTLAMSFFAGSLLPLAAAAALGLFLLIFKKCSEIHDGKPKEITATRVAILSPKTKVWVDS
tara:strand:+ start:1537 stop:2130 length:594 start_codon:yes stop_codon:yes gene_type:complete